MIVLLTLVVAIVAILVVALLTNSKVGMMVRTLWDRMLAAVALLVGIVVLIVGWYGVSGTPYPAGQMPYVISAGVGGLFLLGSSVALWLSADLHDEWRKLDRIEQAIREAKSADPRPVTASAVEYTQQPETDTKPEDRTERERDPATGRLPHVVAEGAS